LERKAGDTTVSLVKGDITDQETDALVNAANSSLMGGGGVDGAIHRKGGPRIMQECRRIRETIHPRGLPTGQAVLTAGGNLRARFVIHTVGPVWKGGDSGEPELLANAYRNSLKIALDRSLRSVSFPSISTGAYGYPVDKASKVALEAVKEFLESNKGLCSVVFVLFSESDLEVYEQAMKQVWANSNQ